MLRYLKTGIFCLLLLSVPALAGATMFPWLEKGQKTQVLADKIPAPQGYERAEVQPGSFVFWLRSLPVKPGSPPVTLYNGEKKHNQNVHYAVLDIDVGTKDLQQCADAVIRLRAEYLFFSDRYDQIHFNFTSGDRAEFTRWANGFRPVVQGSQVTWVQQGDQSSSYSQFRSYLETVMMYAGTASLSRELKPVDSVEDIRPGDVFIQGGFPGHAVLVADTAIHTQTGQKVFLLAQSFMPAQDIHILKNLNNSDISPWYGTDFGDNLKTPEWVFEKRHLMRFSLE
ncbi:MAG: DUF4846 domain-containing protein [Desulfatibacillum sp.]|nr:DUF4846 domain-containing protein [Desulfatibacillum sp.]